MRFIFRIFSVCSLVVFAAQGAFTNPEAREFPPISTPVREETPLSDEAIIYIKETLRTKNLWEHLVEAEGEVENIKDEAIREQIRDVLNQGENPALSPRKIG